MHLRAPTSDQERGPDTARIRAYETAAIDVRIGNDVWTALGARIGETVDNRFPAGAQSITVVTAHNPYGRTRESHINVAAHQALWTRLRSAGVICLSGLGRAPNGSWAEPSIGMVDVPVEQAIAVARSCQQSAMFRWTPGVLTVIWTPLSGVVTADNRSARTVVRAD